MDLVAFSVVSFTGGKKGERHLRLHVTCGEALSAPFGRREGGTTCPLDLNNLDSEP